MNKTTKEQIIAGIREICAERPVVVAVSGGVDSAVALTLAVRAVGKERVTALLMPYGEQVMDDARRIVEWNGVKSEVRQIEGAVQALTQEVGEVSELRRGNMMARVRMIYLYDLAKELGALVVGTENKSEHYLGYYTRYGDEASDVEPLRGLYKTEVWELARELELPESIIAKPPSAGLWEGQTDEGELGFSYLQADMVLRLYVDEGITEVKQIQDKLREQVESEVVARVVKKVQANAFKRQVPYQLT